MPELSVAVGDVHDIAPVASPVPVFPAWSVGQSLTTGFSLSRIQFRTFINERILKQQSNSPIGVFTDCS